MGVLTKIDNWRGGGVDRLPVPHLPASPVRVAAPAGRPQRQL